MLLLLPRHVRNALASPVHPLHGRVRLCKVPAAYQLMQAASASGAVQRAELRPSSSLLRQAERRRPQLQRGAVRAAIAGFCFCGCALQNSCKWDKIIIAAAGGRRGCQHGVGADQGHGRLPSERRKRGYGRRRIRRRPGCASSGGGRGGGGGGLHGIIRGWGFRRGSGEERRNGAR